jgi:hypothetical protein
MSAGAISGGSTIATGSRARGQAQGRQPVRAPAPTSGAVSVVPGKWT